MSFESTQKENINNDQEKMKYCFFIDRALGSAFYRYLDTTDESGDEFVWAIGSTSDGATLSEMFGTEAEAKEAVDKFYDDMEKEIKEQEKLYEEIKNNTEKRKKLIENMSTNERQKFEEDEQKRIADMNIKAKNYLARRKNNQ